MARAHVKFERTGMIIIAINMISESQSLSEVIMGWSVKSL